MEKYFEKICCHYFKASVKNDEIYIRTFKENLPDLAKCLNKISKDIRVGNAYLRDREPRMKGYITVADIEQSMKRAGEKFSFPDFLKIRFNEKTEVFSLSVNFKDFFKWYTVGHPFELADMVDCRNEGTLDYVFTF